MNPSPTTMTNTPQSTRTISEVKIAAINVNSLVSFNKRYDLLQFVNNNNIDIALVSEIKLADRYKVQYVNCNIIRNDRHNSKTGGGTAILIKTHIPYEIMHTPSSRYNQILEYTIVRMNQKRNQQLYMVAVYANNKDKPVYYKEMNHLFEKLKLHQPNHYYIITGDLNSRHVA